LVVAQKQYSQTGRLEYHELPDIMLQAFIDLWSSAAIGPEGPLVFLTGSIGTFISERLKLEKDDVQVLVYSSIAGAFVVNMTLL
jgi:H+/Cl- antiporter ClcA